VQIDALSLRLRPRTPIEAADLGHRLLQANARSVYLTYAAVALPVMTAALATFEFATWLPGLLIWWAKPWLDRSILFVLSQAAFGHRASPRDLWRQRRQYWGRRFLYSWTVRRLSPWRSLTEPVYTLEGLPLSQARRRARQLRRRQIGGALMLTHTFVGIELALQLAILSLVFWFAPPGAVPDVSVFFEGLASETTLLMTVTYAGVVFFLEPFYVAAGFAMYLNRRAELEAWDIEQEFRRAFAA
jgi:hypothetical protein